MCTLFSLQRGRSWWQNKQMSERARSALISAMSLSGPKLSHIFQNQERFCSLRHLFMKKVMEWSLKSNWPLQLASTLSQGGLFTTVRMVLYSCTRCTLSIINLKMWPRLSKTGNFVTKTAAHWRPHCFTAHSFIHFVRVHSYPQNYSLDFLLLPFPISPLGLW